MAGGNAIFSKRFAFPPSFFLFWAIFFEKICRFFFLSRFGCCIYVRSKVEVLAHLLSCMGALYDQNWMFHGRLKVPYIRKMAFFCAKRLENTTEKRPFPGYMEHSSDRVTANFGRTILPIQLKSCAKTSTFERT